MPISARSVFSVDTNSLEAGRKAAATIREGLGGPPALALTYLTVNHDQPAFLKGLREVLGPETCIVGASGQGVIGRGDVREEGYAAGVMGFRAPPSDIAGASVDDITTDTRGKGQALGRALKQKLGTRPKVAVLHYDPLAGVDMEAFLVGMQTELGCPITGGASAHYYGPMQTTYQYFGDRVMSRSAVAFAFGGDVHTDLAISTGCSPVGIEMTVTRAVGTKILEFDGRRAVDVWEEVVGTGPRTYDHTASLALGVPVPGSHETGEYLIRAAFGIDAVDGGVVVHVPIPVGTKVMLHHRTVKDILDGSKKMATDLRDRLKGRKLKAMLCFECGARTVPFLGQEATRDENIKLQEIIDKDAEWLGMVAWGELYPVAGQTGFHNYTYPILALAD